MPQQNTTIDLNGLYGLIRIQGTDAIKFLQGILTCDMQELDHKDHCFGAFCNLKGRIRALFRVFNKADGVYVLTPKELLPAILPVLKKHAMFSKIVISDQSAAWGIWGLIGAKSALSETISNTQVLTLSQTNNDTTQSDSQFIVVCDPIVTPSSLVKTGKINTEDVETWHLFSIRRGIPEVWLETTEKFLPHYLNLPKLGAVSFTKGCYCGQEIIARMEYKGKIKYHLEHKSINSKKIPAPGTEMEIDNKPITVVSTCSTTKDKIEMLVISHQ